MGTASILDINPVDLGMPGKFTTYRDIQARAVADGVDAETRFVAQLLSTGAGKSLSNVTQGRLAGRTVYLSPTRALQTQLLDDFGSVGMVDIRGRSNYPCTYSRPGNNVTCDDGPHMGCKAQRDGACQYVNALGVARGSDLPETSYAYWMAVNKYGEGLGDVDMLVCDEASAAVDEICNVMTIEISNRELKAIPDAKPLTIDDAMESWRTWAGERVPTAKRIAEAAESKLKLANAGTRTSEAAIRELRILRGIVSKLESLAATTGRWVADVTSEYGNGKTTITGFRFDPIWPGVYAEDILYAGSPHVLLTGAGLTRKTCRLLGIPDRELSYFAYPPVFDPARCPVYFIPTARVDFRMSAESVAVWIARIDEILRLWPNSKGIIHTVSYPRAKEIERLSTERRRFITHSSWNTQAKIDEFKRASPNSGAVLVSPVVSTGHSFEYDLGRFQIISKLPMPDTRSRIMKARIEDDPDYGHHLTAQEIDQECGRLMRHPDDTSVTYIVDSHAEWFIPMAMRKGLMSEAFAPMYRRTERIPRV